MLTALFAVAGGLLGSASSPPVAGRSGGLVRMVANLPADSASSSSDDDLANNTPLKYHTFGGALRPLRPLRLAHMEPLPRLARQLISPRDRLILSFVLEYLQTSSLGLSDVALHISGGYVRDLLLGRKSDDLDLSLCLRELHPNITIDTVACGMPDFALERPDLGIEQVEVITCLSEASRGKSVDAAQVRITISSWEEPTIVDLMPTIGKETYDANDRIPRRDVRGTAEEDTLRRDLTICALLLRVTRMEVAPLEMKPAEALREIRSRKRRLELEEAAAKAVEHESGRPEWSILNVDVLDGLAAVRDEHGPARLIFTDPPYNIGIDYGTGKDADSLSDGAYLRWVDEWIGLCCDCLTDDGSLWVMIGDEYAAEYAMILKRRGLTLRSWIKWYETFGVNCQNKFNRTSRHIFYAVKDEKSFLFNPEPVTRPSDRQTKYGDSRASAGGKLWDDVWQIPRLTGTCAERIPDFPTQLPLALVEPIVLCASMSGDLVVDPFNGSGTTGVASVRNGRKYVGVEKSETFSDVAHVRLSGTKVNQ